MRQGTSYYKFIWLQGNDAKGFRPGVNPTELHKFIKIEKQVLSPKNEKLSSHDCLKGWYYPAHKLTEPWHNFRTK